MKYTREEIERRIYSIQYVLKNPNLVSITPEIEKDLKNRLLELQQKLTPHENSTPPQTD